MYNIIHIYYLYIHYLNRTDLVKILSEPKNHCESHYNFMKIIPKN